MIRNEIPDSEIRVYSLASGSSGNSMLVQAGATNVLIDAGLSMRSLAAGLSRHRVGVSDLHAILLTHEHTDHSCGAGAMSRRSGAPLVANERTLLACRRRDDLPFGTQILPTGGEVGIGCIGVRSFPVMHDAVDPVGFVLDTGRHRIAYFTDTGCRTAELREALRGASLAIVEANHDIEWLRRGPYTDDMKARVASSTGHLSNDDCADLLAERLEEEGTLAVWLAHLSRVNNSPSLARRSILARIGSQTRVPVALSIALRDHPSVSWSAGSHAVQLNLF